MVLTDIKLTNRFIKRLASFLMALMAIGSKIQTSGKDKQVDFLKNFIERRMAWLDGKFNIKEGEIFK